MPGKRLLFIAVAALIALFLSVLAWRLWHVSTAVDTPQTKTRSHQTPSESLLMDVMVFRQRALDDTNSALVDSATPQGQAALQALGQELWVSISQETGWGLLTQTSLMMIGATAGDQAMSAFYNPWADVFLLLEWSRQNERWKISDAEIVMGDWFRMVGKAPVNTQPIWLRGNERRSGALALAVADASRTFDALFPAKASATGWRTMLGLAQPEPGRSLNRNLASVNLGGVVLNVAEFMAPTDAASPRVIEIRRSVEQIVAAMAAGKMADVLAPAIETEAIQREALLKIDPATLKELTPIFFIPAAGDKKKPNSGVDTVFLLPSRQLDFCLSLSLSGNPATLKRMTLIPFAAVVDAAQKRSGGEK